MAKKHNNNGPKILLIDIETAPILADVWDIWDQNIGLPQIRKDWEMLSWAAKWLDDEDSQVIYQDRRNGRSEKSLVTPLWKLMNKANVIIWHNGDKFDKKKINTKILLNDIHPPSPYRTIDTLKIAKKHFAMTSNKLEYLAKILGVKYKKLSHAKFPGHSMWTACDNNIIEAWDEMKEYNKHDVLVLQEVLKKLWTWDTTINFDVYNDGEETICKCGSKSLQKKGFHWTNTAKFQAYKCKMCGARFRDRKNLLSKEKKALLKISI